MNEELEAGGLRQVSSYVCLSMLDMVVWQLCGRISIAKLSRRTVVIVVAGHKMTVTRPTSRSLQLATLLTCPNLEICPGESREARCPGHSGGPRHTDNPTNTLRRCQPFTVQSSVTAIRRQPVDCAILFRPF